MSYASKADLQNRLTDERLVELTDFEDAGVVVDARITEALDFGTGQIDSYAGGRYGTPLVVSNQVKNLCLDFAVWRLFANRDRLSDAAQAGYDAGMKLLKDVASGTATLDGQTAGTTQTSEMDVRTRDHDESPEVFDNNKLGSY